MSDDGYTFRHFPGEEGGQPFDSRPPNAPRMSTGGKSSTPTENINPGEFVPYQILEQPGPGDGEMTTVKEINVQAPQPIHSSPLVAQTLQDLADETTPPARFGVDEPTPPLRARRNNAPSQMSSNDADDEQGWKAGSARATSSLGSSEVDFASSGLVHLPPIGRLETAKRTREWRGKLQSGTQSSSSAPNSQPSSQHHPPHSHPASQTSSSLAASSIPPRIEEEPAEEEKQSREGTGNYSMVTTSSHDGGPVVTMRFEHQEDEDGHHVLVGREGKLMRCEDEPIRIPGAVQGFGVFMVVHDDRESGQMQIRQVSEVCLIQIVS